MNDAAIVLDQLTTQAGRLYSLPAVAMRVLELTDSPRVDTRALKECIENDPALTAKLLRVVNSSLFGLSREVSDLNQALALLGTKPLKLLVLGFSLPTGLFSNVQEEILGWYWRRTLIRAVAAREISETWFHTPGDEAFIAGLLRDLGLLLLIQQLGEPYVKFVKKVIDRGSDLTAMERKSMGFDHTTASAKLLSYWGLPETLIEAIAYDGSPSLSSAKPSSDKALPRILRIAELFARLLADGRSAALHEVLEAGQEYRDLSSEQLEALVDDLQQKVQQLADVLSLKLPNGLDYRDVVVQAHAQLAAVAEETVGDIVHVPVGGVVPSEEDALLAELRGLAEAVVQVSRQPVAVVSEVETPPPTGPQRSQRPTPRAAESARAESAHAEPAHAKPGRAESAQVSAASAPAEPALLARLTVAASACRQSRSPLSLLLVQLDHVDELRWSRGVNGFETLPPFLESVCRNVDHPAAVCLRHGESGTALVLPDCERRRAVELGNQLTREVRRLAPVDGHSQRHPISVSVGVATVAMPPKNFIAEDLFAAADRCLYAAHASGGSLVKSIEIY
ncbi:MAG: HDOD domain-containing protein [Pirellulales bacterium]|nr:HDOD domain-containing protein [Pirellulales bacterium]